MKKKSIVFFLLLSLFGSAQAISNGKSSIKGHFEGLADGTKILLIPGNTHSDEKPLAESIVKDGSFEFPNLTQDGPRMYLLKLEKKNGFFQVVIDNEEVSITGKASFKDQGNQSYFKLENPIVENGKTNELYLQKRSPMNILDSLYRAYNQNNEATVNAYSKAKMNKDTAAIRKIGASSEYKKLESDEREFFKTVESTITGIVLDNKNTWWGPFLMLNSFSYFTPEQKPLFEAFSQEAKDSYYGKIIKKELFPEGFVGKPAPVFTVTDSKGNKIKSTSLYKGKKYILIDFWASWCNPCRKEIPNVKAQYAKYASKGFEVISISIDQVEADWQKALKAEQLSWPNFRDLDNIANLYNVRAIPSTFLLDEKGTILVENLRGEALGAKLDALFK